MGRDFFLKYWAVFRLIINVFKVFPDFLRGILWSVSANKTGKLFVALRYFVFSSRVKKFDKNTYLGSYLVLKNIDNLSLGSNLSIHDFCYLDAVGGIDIGNNVSIAHGCSLVSFNHSWGDANTPIKYNPIELGRIVLEDDVWIGCGVRIMSGVTIKTRSIVAAGAVVVKDVPSGVIVAGVPARVIKKI